MALEQKRKWRALPICLAASLGSSLSLAAENAPVPVISPALNALISEAQAEARVVEAPAKARGVESAPADVPAPTADPTVETELVQERYPDGKVKLAREVIPDSKGN